MRDSWLELVDSVLRPARPHLARCLGERERHLDARKVVAEQRARAVRRCEIEIEQARAAVFAANDGVVPGRMRALEREWILLTRSDPDAGLMDLWARIAPREWLDRKRWRDSAPAARLDATIALAADPTGIDAAEAAVEKLRVALGVWERPIGAAIRWCAFAQDTAHVAALLQEPLNATLSALVARHAPPAIMERARRLEGEVHEAALARLPERPCLAGDIAHAALVDALWRAAPRCARPSPVEALRDLWRTGYTLSAIDPSGVTLELPPL